MSDVVPNVMSDLCKIPQKGVLIFKIRSQSSPHLLRGQKKVSGNLLPQGYAGHWCKQAKGGQARLHNLTMGQVVAIFGKCGGGSKLNLLSLKSNQELQFFPRVKVFNQRNVLSLLRQAERKINELIF